MKTKAVAIGHKYRFDVTSRFPDGIDRLEAGLEQEFDGSVVGNIWRTAEVIVRAGVDWTGWISYHDNLRSAYLRALGGKPEYRDGVWASDKERKADMWAHNELAFSLNMRIYIPDEVPMPVFVEGKSAKPSILRWMAEKRSVSMDVVYDYFLKSFDSQQFLRGNASYEPSIWPALLDAKFILSGDDIAVSAAITDLTMVEARAVLTALSQKPVQSVSANHKLIENIRQTDEKAVNLAVREVRDWSTTYLVTPPPTMTWSDFQSFRQQIKGMAVALGDLYVDIIRKKYPLDHMKLTSG